jgi:hypothetical protein
MSEQAKVMGENIIHAVNFLRRKKGANGVTEVAKQVDFDMTNIFLERWYPVDNYIKLLEILDKKFDYKDYSASFRIGFDRSRQIGLLNDGGINPEPKAAFGKVQESWWRFNNFGKIELKDVDEKHIDIYICDNIDNTFFCERMRGFFAGILREVCKKDEPKVKKTKCTSSGEKYCKFEATWG